MPGLIDLGYNPRPWQARVHAGLRRWSVVVVHRRGGKTVMAVMSLFHAALAQTRPESRYAYVAPYLKQAKDVAWSYIKGYAHMIPGCTVNESELWIQLPHNGARIRVYGADNADAMRGLYFDGVVLDEVADMKPDVWGSIIRPTLSDYKGWAMFIGTAKGVNMLSEKYFAALENPDWFHSLSTCYDTGVLSNEEIEDMRKGMSVIQFRQEMLCDFSTSVENQLISFEDVQTACGKHLPLPDYEYSPRIIGVDVARYGGDRSVIFPRQGLAALEPQVFASIDNMSLAGKVAETINNWQPDGVFIDAGRGEGVIDRLRQLGYAPTPVDFGGKANKVIYANKRAEMWHSLAEWIKSGGALPNIASLKIDLCAPTYSYANAAGKFALESKDDMKKRGLPSPDLADALALTFAQPVAVTRGPGANLMGGHAGHCVTDYDVFA